MGKEAKLGVALIAVLLSAFGLVLYKRIKEASPPIEPAAAAGTEAKPSAGELEKPKLSSGPLKPTVVQSAPAGKSPQTLAGSSTAPARESVSRYENYPPQASATATDDDRTTRDPFESSAGTAGSRDGDRYSSTAQQVYGPANSAAADSPDATTTEDASTAATTATPGRADPFSGYGQRAAGGTLTPTGDASAALLPASATAEATHNQAEDRSEVPERTAAESNPAAEINPLRSAGSDQSTVSSSARTSAPRSYDLYGDAADSTNPATKEMPTDSEASKSHVRFEPSASGSRYASEAASNTNRYSTSTTADVPASPSRTRADSNSGWSGAGTAVNTGPSAATSVTAPPRSTASPIAPVTQPKPSRTVPAVVQRGETYIVQPNDSFSTISEKLYGTSSFFKALQEHNKAKYPQPDRLRTGNVVATPSVETLLQKYPSLCPRPSHLPLPGRSSSLASQRGGRVYVVEEGDTLFDIARFELGKATRWAEIYELNKDVIGEDFNHLRPGTQLVLPVEIHDDTFTRRPNVSVPR